MAAEDGGRIPIMWVWAAIDWPHGPPVRVPGRRFAALAPESQAQQAVFAVDCDIPTDWDLDRAMAAMLTPDALALVECRQARVAVFGRRQRPGMRLSAGDRIELLGPIWADPKAARRRRVEREREGESGRKWRPG